LFYISRLQILFLVYLLLIVLNILAIFYRYKPHKKRYDNNLIVSPAEGLVSYIKQKEMACEYLEFEGDTSKNKIRRCYIPYSYT
jgi:hypothetical protein